MSEFKDLIASLSTMNDSLANVSVVRTDNDSDSDDEEKKPIPKVCCSAHIEEVKRIATQNGWQLTELIEPFGQAKFENDGHTIDWEWSEEGKASNKFLLNYWDDTETGLRTVLNVRPEDLPKVFANGRSLDETFDFNVLRPKDL